MKTSRSSVAIQSLALASLFAVIFFAKLWVVGSWSTDVPFWDQWDAEGRSLLLPWKEGTLRFLDFFAAHNEHRIALTRVLVLTVTALNGQWDARLEMICNAVIHSLTAVAIVWWMRSLVKERWQVVAAMLAVAITFAPPHSWQNTLGGFHSQQYFLIGFSLFGMDAVIRHSAWSRWWWAGIVALWLVLFSMGTGFAASFVLLPSLLLLFGPLSAAWRRNRVSVLFCVPIVFSGFLLRVHYAGHDVYQAQTLGDFFQTLWRSLQWPLEDYPPFALLSFLPWVVLAFRVYLTRPAAEVDPRHRVIVAVGVWQVLQLVATAYARGAGGLWPASRYLDGEMIGLLLNFTAGLALVIRPFEGPRLAALWRFTFVVWCIAVIYGVYGEVHRTIRSDSGALRSMFGSYLRSTVSYLATQDRSWIKEGEIPYPSAAEFEERLSHEIIVDLLPVSVRRALVLEEDRARGFALKAIAEGTDALVSAPSWGSALKGGDAPTGSEWYSRTVARPKSGFLKFEMVGDVGKGAVSVELWTDDLSKKLETVVPSKVPGLAWRAAYVKSPPVPFRVVAKDSDPNAWIGFSAPSEMATGSYYAWRLTQTAPLLFWISLCVFASALVAWSLSFSKNESAAK